MRARILLIVVFGLIFLSACTCSPASLSTTPITQSPLIIASVTLPILNPSWNDIVLRRVALILEQSYVVDHPNFYSITTEILHRLLAESGIEVVENPPYDATIKITVNGIARQGRYQREDTLGKLIGGLVSSWEQAEATVDISISTDGRESIASQGYYLTDLISIIREVHSLGEAPMDIAVTQASLFAFSKLWGESLFTFALEDPNQEIRYLSAMHLGETLRQIAHSKKAFESLDKEKDAELIKALERLGQTSFTPEGILTEDVTLALVEAYLKELTLLVSREIYDALQQVGPGPKGILLLIQVLKNNNTNDISYQRARMVIESIGPESRDSVPALIDEISTPSVSAHVIKALTAITGQNFGNDLNLWQKWWEENK